jgi:hypothetical protein
MRRARRLRLPAWALRQAVPQARQAQQPVSARLPPTARGRMKPAWARQQAAR